MMNYSQYELEEVLSQVLVPITVSAVEDGTSFRFISINPAHMEVSGLVVDSFIGRGPQDLLPEAEAARVLGRYQKAAETGLPLTYDEILTLPKGRFWWRTSISTIKSQSGEVQRLCVSSVPVDLEIRLRDLANDLAADLAELSAVQPVVTQAIEGTLHTLASIAEIAKTLIASPRGLSQDERHLIQVIHQLAVIADESLEIARHNGFDLLSEIVMQTLLAQGSVADLLVDLAEDDDEPSQPM